MLIETPIILNLKDVHFTDEQFNYLCQANPDWNLEETAQGELLIMPPIGGISGEREANLIIDLGNWNRQTKLGKVFSSSTVFRLPNGGKRSPDAAWIKLERWNQLTLEEREKFPPICPDFVIELRSKTDQLKPLQEKMQEYLNSGLKLGWLINTHAQEVEIYRSNLSVEVVKFPIELNGEDILPNFVFSLPFEE
ncbi:MAG: Uma2 family endonuclease [Microcystaceae cyanobacterium]